ncbi:ImmA/IrrE family metallo-endopeptidase [Bartonella sp. CB74]|uniref:ImmA/IrrE family metallo-endopeptidase n=1 Tax=Bartonella sp. CB74 TaxID=3113620 RepID=UPI002F962E0E
MNKSLDYEVPSRGWKEISNITNGIRKTLGLSHYEPFPILHFLEFILAQMMSDSDFTFLVLGQKEMGNIEGLTHPQGKFIAIRQSVYEKACNNDGRSNFTLAHELGHFMLHTNLPFQRAVTSGQIPPYRSAEKQANQFAAELLMPRQFILQHPTIDEIVKICKVSWQAAKVRFKKVNGFEL